MSIAFNPVTSTLRIVLDPRLLDPHEAWKQHCRDIGISENAIWVAEWTERMAQAHGGVVRGHNRDWDWGQALRVEQEGSDPSAWSDRPAPTDDDVARARAWETGDWPAWVRSPRTGTATE